MITDSIPQIFHNCLTVKNIDGEFFPLRFSDSLFAYYDSIDKGTSIRAHSCAGITMDFYTTDNEFSFCYKTHAFCRPMMVFDFFEDGVFLGSFVSQMKAPPVPLRIEKSKKGKFASLFIYLTVRRFLFLLFAYQILNPSQIPKSAFCFWAIPSRRE